MRHLLFFLLFLSFSGAWAQDFRCIVPGEDRFYMDAGRMLGLRILTSETVEEGIIHHFNHDLRPAGFNDPSGCNTASSCEEMEGDAVFTGNGASWMGTHMVERPDGYNLFFNFQGDTIRVNTLAAESESWTMFSWGDSLQLIATITSIDELTVNGALEDVKTISFQAIDSNADLYDHPLNSQQWQLSRHDGFVRVHSLYWFPDLPDPLTTAGYECLWGGFSEHEHYSPGLIEQMDATPPSEGRMYNLDVGDEFQIRETGYGAGQGLKYKRYILTEKMFNGSTLSLQFDVEAIDAIAGTVDTYEYTVNSTDTSNIFPLNLLPNQLGDLPYNEQWSRPVRCEPVNHPQIYSMDGGQQMLDSIAAACNLQYVRVTESDNLFGSNSTCYDYWSVADGCYGPFVYLSGIPVPAVSQGCVSGGYTNVPIYINTSTCQFGSLMYVDVEEAARPQPLSIHPNPASTILRFDSPAPAAYTVMDAMGRTVMQGQAQLGQNTLSVDGLRDGMYVLRLEDGSGEVRFVKAGQ